MHILCLYCIWEERGGLSLLTKKKKNTNYNTILFQGLAFKPSGHDLPGAEEPYLVILGITPDSASQAHFKVISMTDFSSFRLIEHNWASHFWPSSFESTNWLSSF